MGTGGRAMPSDEVMPQGKSRHDAVLAPRLVEDMGEGAADAWRRLLTEGIGGGRSNRAQDETSCLVVSEHLFDEWIGCMWKQGDREKDSWIVHGGMIPPVGCTGDSPNRGESREIAR